MTALLTDNGQQILSIPGRTVHHASASYQGDAKSGAKDAFIIVVQAHMRCDLQPLHRGNAFAMDLRILVSRRLDLAGDRTRAINWMQAQLLGYFPAAGASLRMQHFEGVFRPADWVPDASRPASGWHGTVCLSG
ncbi:hypothetical protein BM536_036890 [Streptomyces phaeoluteigriseus]|uniref:Transposase IS110-like N-terminal domain-containing protein n=2 Tax=Streptomyces phaeoluteigriseus TaxID=114686 RepID=A0A1V6MI05_9ACTN|nr:hypothetical protein BM536_036890 [Streptomyces phaeoluteigriseus]